MVYNRHISWLVHNVGLRFSTWNIGSPSIINIRSISYADFIIHVIISLLFYHYVLSIDLYIINYLLIYYNTYALRSVYKLYKLNKHKSFFYRRGERNIFNLPPTLKHRNIISYINYLTREFNSNFKEIWMRFYK